MTRLSERGSYGEDPPLPSSACGCSAISLCMEVALHMRCHPGLPGEPPREHGPSEP